MVDISLLPSQEYVTGPDSSVEAGCGVKECHPDAEASPEGTKPLTSSPAAEECPYNSPYGGIAGKYDLSKGIICIGYNTKKCVNGESLT